MLAYVKGNLRIHLLRNQNGVAEIRIQLIHPKTQEVILDMPAEDDTIELEEGDRLTLEGAVTRWTSKVVGRKSSGGSD